MTTIYCKLFTESMISSKVRAKSGCLRVTKRFITQKCEIGVIFSSRVITPLHEEHLQLNIGATHQQYNHLYIVFDGFIPNYKTMCETHGINTSVHSSAWGLSRALIASIYMKHGFAHMLLSIKGEYSVLLLDLRDPENPLFYVASDRVGAYPIYVNGDVLFSNAQFSDSKPMEPGTWELHQIVKTEPNNTTWKMANKYRYFSIEKAYSIPFLLSPFQQLINTFHKELKSMIPENKNVICLLSGGLFSCVMTIFLSYYIPNLKTVFIGTKQGSRGYYSAMMLSERLRTVHTNILVDEMDFCRVSGNVISLLQTTDKYAVRNGCVHYVGASAMNDQFFDEDVTVFLGEGGANAFVSAEDEEIYQDMFQYEHLFNATSSYLKPTKTDELVRRVHHIYCREFGFSVRFPYFNSTLQDTFAKYETSRDELVGWLANYISETYSEYVSYHSPIVSAFPLGIYYEQKMRQFSQTSEQEYYDAIFAESNKWNEPV